MSKRLAGLLCVLSGAVGASAAVALAPEPESAAYIRGIGAELHRCEARAMAVDFACAAAYRGCYGVAPVGPEVAPALPVAAAGAGH